MEEDVSEPDSEASLSLVQKYRDYFALSMDELGCTSLTKMNIIQEPGSRPVQSKPYRTSVKERNEKAAIVTSGERTVSSQTLDLHMPVLFFCRVVCMYVL